MAVVQAHAMLTLPRPLLPHTLQVFLIPVMSCIHEVLAMSLGYYHDASKVWTVFISYTKMPNIVIMGCGHRLLNNRSTTSAWKHSVQQSCNKQVEQWKTTIDLPCMNLIIFPPQHALPHGSSTIICGFPLFSLHCCTTCVEVCEGC